MNGWGYMLAQALPVNKHPICPTLVHDETTRLVIMIALLSLSCLTLWKVMKHFNEP